MRALQKNLITIITPTKNCKNNLKDTILSVKRLKTNYIEHIIIDGNSTDGTIDLIKEFDDCIDYWVSENDSGLYDAMNKGWSVVSRDRYVLFLGAGDKLVSLPTEDLENFNDKVIYGRVQMERNIHFVSRLNTITRFANTIHHQGMLLPKSLHIDPPFNIKYKVYADFDLVQRLLKRKFSFVYSESFVTYAMPGGLSDNYSKEAYRIAYKNFGPLFGIASYLFYYYQMFKKNKKISLLLRKQY